MRWRPRHWFALAGLAVLAGYPLVRPNADYHQTVLLLAFLLAIEAISWNIISGLAGYVSLGQTAFLGIGAYTVAILSTRWGGNPLAYAPLAGVVAAVAALVLGALVLRAKGHAFVIITIAALVALQICALNFDSLTNGSTGLTLALPFWPLDWLNMPFYYMFLALMVLTFLFAAWIRRTKLGTGLVAIRDDEGKAGSIGVNTTVYKVLAYMASAVFIGVAGGIYAYFLTFISPAGTFNILASVAIVLACLVGGRGTLWGPVIGAFIVQFASEAATVYGGSERARLLLLGPALVLIVLFLPDGLLPTAERVLTRRRAADRTVAYIDQAGALERTRISVAGRTTPPADPRRPVLELRGVRKRFGGLQVLDGVDLTVAEGSVSALIGPNGSGKTTLFNLVSGTLSVDGGEIWFAGQRIERRSPWRRAHLGLGRTFQVTRLFRSMTVLENVVAPLPSFSWRTLAADSVAGHEAERARDLLSFVGLGQFAEVPAAALSFGQQKLVELAQVLMAEPKLILLDEPAGGVNPALVDRIVELVADLNRQGITFLIVEHNIPLVLETCDPVTVLYGGRVIAAGPPSVIRADEAVLDAYLGTPVLAGGGDPAGPSAGGVGG